MDSKTDVRAPPLSTPNADSESQQRWLAVQPAGMRWAQWDTDNSLFHGETGDTHVLSEFAALILQAIRDEPRTVAWLSDHSATLCEARDDPRWRRKICTLLRTFDELELAERVDDDHA